VEIVFERLNKIPNIKILAPQHQYRLPVISFYIEDMHFNLGVKLLNDHFGIQTRGGCSCAGTYGHYLLHVDQQTSQYITCEIDEGNLSHKPGWLRMSLHPTTTTQELEDACHAIEQLAENFETWAEEYKYDPKTNEYTHKSARENIEVEKWFEF